MVTLQCQMVEHTERRPTLGVILATQYKETNIFPVMLDQPGHQNLFASEVYKAISIDTYKLLKVFFIMVWMIFGFLQNVCRAKYLNRFREIAVTIGIHNPMAIFLEKPF